MAGDTGDEIRLIDPDGGGDRTLWSHGLDDASDTYDVWSLAWSPDATKFAFASTHENWCSINASDVFVVGADGAGYRRVTQAPACAALAAFPQGAVTVPVVNRDVLAQFTGFLYLQGAPEIQQVSLGPGATGAVTFASVADLGPGVVQVAAFIDGTGRQFDVGSAVDVVADGSVTSALVGLYSPGLSWEPRSPTWTADGSTLGYAYGFNSLFQIVAEPEPIDFGASLLAQGATIAPNIVLHMAFGPTPETADQVLHQGNAVGTSEGLYLTTLGGATSGEPLISYESFDSIKGLSWLPDGSGFVYSVTDNELLDDGQANIYHFDLTAGEATQVTDLVGEYTGLLSVSPDGRSVVFERADEASQTDLSLVDPDLWTVGLDGSDPQLLIEGARAPAWSW